MLPTTEAGKRIAVLYGRKLTTPWAEKEIRQFKKLYKAGCFNSLDDLALIERYYSFERRKGDKGIHRRDLFTFLNNYLGELDRSTAWANRFGGRAAKKDWQSFARRELGIAESPATDDDFKRIGQLAKSEMERFRASLSPQTTAE